MRVWWISLFCTITVYGSDESRHFLGFNVAQGKRTWQVPGVYSEYNSSLAVDGQTDSRVRDGHCSHTAEGIATEPTWTVDLAEPYYITGIQIYNRDGDNKRRMRNFKVTGSRSRTDQKYEIYSDGEAKYFDSIISITLDGTRPFQTVEISIPRGHNAYLTLCEVLIYVGCNPVLTNGHYSPKQRFYESGRTVDIICNEGFTVRAHRQDTCQDGNWRSNSACEPITCLLPSLHHGGYTQARIVDNIHETTLPYGRQVSPYCDAGHTLVDQVSPRTCKHDARWSGNDPKCIPTTCKLLELENGFYVDVDGNIVPASAQYSFNTTVWPQCNYGSRLADNGQNTLRRCGSGDDWDGPEPTCELIMCEWPLQLMNGQYIDEDGGQVKRIGTNITATCEDVNQNKFSLVAKDRVRTCQYDGQWSGEEARCVPMCKAPSVGNGKYRDRFESRDYYAEGHVVELVCFPGYERTSNEPLECTSNHTWNGLVDQCKVVRCPLKTIKFGQYNPAVDWVNYFDIVTIHCNRGYKVVGPRARYCQANRTLSDADPYCTKIFCDGHGPVDNGEVSGHVGERVAFGSVVNISCNDGFFLGTGPRRRTCLWTEKWSEQDPKCKELPLLSRISNEILICGCVIFVACTTLSVALCVIDRRKKRNA